MWCLATTQHSLLQVVTHTTIGACAEAEQPEFLVISVSDSGLEYEWNYL